MDRITTSTLTSTSTVFTTSKDNKKHNARLTATSFSKNVTDVKNISSQYTSRNIPSSSRKEKTREYRNVEEAAKKEKGIKIEKRGNKTNITISGVSGVRIGNKTEHDYTMPKQT